MRFINILCPPALLYLLYIVVQVGLDLSLGLWLTAIVKIISGIAGTIILDTLCGVELGIVSWAIVATPFLMTAAATTIALGLGIDRMASKYVTENFTSPTPVMSKKTLNHLGAEPVDKKDAMPLSSTSMY